MLTTHRTIHGRMWCSLYCWHTLTHTHARTHHLTALYPGLPGWAGTRKVKPVWILPKQETVSGSGIRWAVCKSAPRSRQIAMPAPHHSVFYRLDALPATQPTASKHWRHIFRMIDNLISLTDNMTVLLYCTVLYCWQNIINLFCCVFFCNYERKKWCGTVTTFCILFSRQQQWLLDGCVKPWCRYCSCVCSLWSVEAWETFRWTTLQTSSWPMMPWPTWACLMPTDWQYTPSLLVFCILAMSALKRATMTVQVWITGVDVC